MLALHKAAREIEDLQCNRAGVIPVRAQEIVSLITKALDEH
jgi:hypothetical protein